MTISRFDCPRGCTLKHTAECWDRNPWLCYEAEKAALNELELSPEEYIRRIGDITYRLGL